VDHAGASIGQKPAEKRAVGHVTPHDFPTVIRGKAAPQKQTNDLK
jgi:hypothetical protein